MVCTGPLYHLKHAKYQNNKKTHLKEQGNDTLKWPKRKGGRLSSNLYTKDTHSIGSIRITYCTLTWVPEELSPRKIIYSFPYILGDIQETEIKK